MSEQWDMHLDREDIERWFAEHFGDAGLFLGPGRGHRDGPGRPM
jgi:hypothetical protein